MAVVPGFSWPSPPFLAQPPDGHTDQKPLPRRAVRRDRLTRRQVDGANFPEAAGQRDGEAAGISLLRRFCVPLFARDPDRTVSSVEPHAPIRVAGHSD